MILSMITATAYKLLPLLLIPTAITYLCMSAGVDREPGGRRKVRVLL